MHDVYSGQVCEGVDRCACSYTGVQVCVCVSRQVYFVQ